MKKILLDSKSAELLTTILQDRHDNIDQNSFWLFEEQENINKILNQLKDDREHQAAV